MGLALHQRICLAALVAGLLCAPGAFSAAQTAPDPVVAAFREYKSAHDRGDLPGAEAAARRALAASEARDGDMGVTAVLAMNLALAELDLGHKAEAIAPARRALDLARGGAKGVDQLTLRLMLGEAELATVPTADEQDLVAALHAADGRADLDSYSYPAAVTLAVAAQRMRRYDVMLDAARIAERHAAGSGTEVSLAQGRALVTQGLALAAMHRDQEAGKGLLRALDLLAPLAPEAADDSETLGELSYAQAKALQGAVLARMTSEGVEPRSDHKLIERPTLKDRPPLCPGGIVPAPYPRYPNDMENGYSVGSVILRAHVNAKGDVTALRVLAIFPEGSFRQSVLDPEIKWKFVSTKPLPGCRVETTDFIASVRFSLR